MKYSILYVIFGIFFTWNPAFCFLSGPIAGRTGAPDDICGSKSCNDPAACHGSYNINSGTAAFLIAAPSSYVLGETIDVTVSFSNTSSGLHGFQLTALDASNKRVGIFQSKDNTTQTEAYLDEYAAHTTVGTARTSWTVQWTAPLANVTDPVIFYAAGNQADGGGTPENDYIYNTAAAVIIPPTPTPTPAVTDGECDAETIQLSQNALELQKGENREIVVTVKGENDCVAEGISVKATIKKGKKRISLSRETGTTDEIGQIAFTITAKKKTGKATVVFKADGIKSKLKVTITSQ
ncbi:MAG: Reeler domain-containing protein [Candidatus Kuenenia sp.]|nr:Reeler domain-containing protein [Candidatus Kuenenia sp.]